MRWEVSSDSDMVVASKILGRNLLFILPLKQIGSKILPMRTKIYYMTDAAGNVRYVGKTSKSLKQRCLDHLKECRQQTKSFYRLHWLRQMQREGFTPLLNLIEEVDGNGSERERYWIQFYRDSGCRLVNGTDGGEGVPGLKFSPEAIERNRQAHLGRVPWNKGKTMSEAARRKMSEARKGKAPPNKGRPLSEETKRKLREAAKGREISEGTRQKISEALRGHETSEATKQKIGRKLKGEGNGMYGVRGRKHPTFGKPLSEEHRRKLSEAHKGQIPWNKKVK